MPKQLIEWRTQFSTVHKQPIEYQNQLIEKHFTIQNKSISINWIHKTINWTETQRISNNHTK